MGLTPSAQPSSLLAVEDAPACLFCGQQLPGWSRRTERLALRVPEVAELLSTPQRTVYRWIADGRLPTIRVGRVVLVPRRALEEWLERETRRR